VLESVDIEYLETQIDKTENSFDMEKAFVMPGKCELSSRLDMARTVCRRLERRVIALDKKLGVDALIKKYINRLSDYLFILARKLANDAGVEEHPWVPRKA
jgi:cob(I)alamin adenosyltransferase